MNECMANTQSGSREQPQSLPRVMAYRCNNILSSAYPRGNSIPGRLDLFIVRFPQLTLAHTDKHSPAHAPIRSGRHRASLASAGRPPLLLRVAFPWLALGFGSFSHRPAALRLHLAPAGNSWFLLDHTRSRCVPQTPQSRRPMCYWGFSWVTICGTWFSTCDTFLKASISASLCNMWTSSNIPSEAIIHRTGGLTANHEKYLSDNKWIFFP